MRIKPTSSDSNTEGPGTRRSRSSDHARKRLENRHLDDATWKFEARLLPHEEVDARGASVADVPKPKLPRLDAWLVAQDYAPSREKAKALVAQGKVSINGQPAKKAATPIDPTDVVEVSH